MLILTCCCSVQCGALTAVVQKEIVTEADRLEIRNKVSFGWVFFCCSFFQSFPLSENFSSSFYMEAVILHN